MANSVADGKEYICTNPCSSVTHDLGYRDIRRLQASSYDEIKSQAKEPAQKKPQPNPTIRHDVLESKGKKKANTHK
jgi:hypothetical protein